jgi:putative ABC transport system substrate-binding protein
MRREFISVLGGVAALPLAARAQQPIPMVGFLNSASPNLYASRVHAFHEGLRETGYVEGRNVAVEYRWAYGQNSRLSGMAADLVRSRVAVIAAGGQAAVLAAKSSTSTIPIVITTASDPVRTGLIASLNRPGGNLTGATNLNAELAAKRLQLLHELVPTASKVALLVNSANPNAAEVETSELQGLASTLGLQLHVWRVSAEVEFDTGLAGLGRANIGALLVGADNFFNSQSRQLAIITVRHRIPAIQNSREFAEAGGLASYGGDGKEAYRLMGIYTGRILKGEKPSDLPVQQATKAEFVINLKTAKALGLSIPLPLLARADGVIE